jgi:hypothetical protein
VSSHQLVPSFSHSSDTYSPILCFESLRCTSGWHVLSVTRDCNLAKSTSGSSCPGRDECVQSVTGTGGTAHRQGHMVTHSNLASIVLPQPPPALGVGVLVYDRLPHQHTSYPVHPPRSCTNSSRSVKPLCHCAKSTNNWQVLNMLHSTPALRNGVLSLLGNQSCSRS